MSGEVISINVGGAIFTTSVATLTKYPESMLAAMFDPESERPPATINIFGVPPARKDGYGNFFIDGEPKPFEVILRFLRRGKLCEDLGGCTLEQLEWEADYFGLDELLKIIGERKMAETKRKKAEEKKEKERKKAEEEKVKKRRNEEDEMEKKRPKMSPLEYEEKAVEMRGKWAEASRKQLEFTTTCFNKCVPNGKKCEYCQAIGNWTCSLYNLATKYEGKAADLRRDGYDN